MSSHQVPPARFLPCMFAGVPAPPPWLDRYANSSWPCLPFASNPLPQYYHHPSFHCAPPPRPLNRTRSNTSFLIKDILSSTDPTSQSTSATGESNHSGDFKNELQRMYSFYVLPTQKERLQQLGYSRTRTMFTQQQLKELEASFQRQNYISTPERIEIAERLRLDPLTVKTWFQNQRMKRKKELQLRDPFCKPTRAKGRPPKHAIDLNDEEEEVVVDV